MTDDRNVLRKVTETILATLPYVREQDIGEEADLFSLGLDSMNAINLVMNLEESFLINFDLGEIDYEQFRSAGTIADLIVRKLLVGSVDTDGGPSR